MYGAPRSLLIAAHALGTDFDVEIFTYGQGELVTAAHEMGIPITVINEISWDWLSTGGEFSRFVRAVLRRTSAIPLFMHTMWVLKKKTPDLVYVNTVANANPVRLSRLLGLDVLVHVREGADYIFSQNLRRKKISGYIFKNVDSFICVSEAVKKLVLRRLDGRNAIVNVVHNGIDCAEFRAASSETIDMSVNQGRKVVGFLGNVSKRKGIDIFLTAAKELSEKRNDVIFMVVGGESKVFTDFAREAGIEGLIDKFVFHKQFIRSPQTALKMFDIFCMTSLIEPFARVNLEAACFQKAIIATNVDGNPEFVIDGITGLLIPPNDPQSLVQSIGQLLDDEQMRGKLGFNASQRVQNEFTVEKYVHGIRSHINAIFNG